MSDKPNLVRMPIRTDRAADTSPRSLLLDCLNDLDQGRFNPTGLVIMSVDESEDGATYVPHYWMGGPSFGSFRKLVGWIEVFKAKFLADLVGSDGGW